MIASRSDHQRNLWRVDDPAEGGVEIDRAVHGAVELLARELGLLEVLLAFVFSRSVFVHRTVELRTLTRPCGIRILAEVICRLYAFRRPAPWGPSSARQGGQGAIQTQPGPRAQCKHQAPLHQIAVNFGLRVRGPHPLVVRGGLALGSSSRHL